MEASPLDDWLRKAFRRPRNAVALASCITFLLFLFDGSNYGEGYTRALIAEFYEVFCREIPFDLKRFKS